MALSYGRLWENDPRAINKKTERTVLGRAGVFKIIKCVIYRDIAGPASTEVIGLCSLVIIMRALISGGCHSYIDPADEMTLRHCQLVMSCRVAAVRVRLQPGGF